MNEPGHVAAEQPSEAGLPRHSEATAGWYCEHCDKPADGISDNAEINERHKCDHCKHHTVVWLEAETIERRKEAMQVHAPTAAVKEEQAATIPEPRPTLSAERAAALFQKLHQAIE